MKVAFIGMGSMGAAIVPRLVGAGHEVHAWNRSSAAVECLAGVGLLDSPVRAFAEHEVVITMLSDDQAVREVILESGALAAARPGVVHMVMSTISPRFVEQLQAPHAAAGVHYLAATVFGIPAVAARGELNILAAGSADALDKVAPLLAVMSKKIWPLGEQPAHANIAKIAGNLMITQAIESMAEASALVESHGLAPAAFLDVVTHTMFACSSYQRYAGNICGDSYEPGFKLSLGLKDVRLALDAAAVHGASLPSAAIVRTHMETAVREGKGDRDWSILALAARDAALEKHLSDRSSPG